LVLRRYDNIYWTSRVIKGRGSPTVYALKTDVDVIGIKENQDLESLEEVKKKSDIVQKIEELIKEGVISSNSSVFEKLEKYGVWNFSDLVMLADNIPLSALTDFLSYLEDLRMQVKAGVVEEGLDF